jgi:YHS domain-containing protein
MVKDVVCGMMVDETTAQWESDYKGEPYYFCAPGCKRSFDTEPEKYLGDSPMSMGHGDMPHHDRPHK